MIIAVFIIVPTIIAMYVLYRMFVNHLTNPYAAQQHSNHGVAQQHSNHGVAQQLSRVRMLGMRAWWEDKVVERLIHWRVHRAAMVMNRHAKRHRAKALAAQQDSHPCETCCVTKTLSGE